MSGHVRSRRPDPRLPLAFAALLSATGCNPHSIEKLAMSTVYRPGPPRPATVGPYRILAGDLHCHVSPPDDPRDVSRGLAETVALAREEALDFVVLTPHVPARFYLDADLRAKVLLGQSELRRAIAANEVGRTLFIPGFEYTDHRYGHVGTSFADLERVLAEVRLEVARAAPARFFAQWVADGGVLVVNHPLVTPVDSILPTARADLSWRPWTSRAEVPPEIAAVDRLAIGFEAYNAAVSHLRDRFLLGDPDASVRAILGRLDREIVSSHRRMTPVGGSDSHVGYLRPTTFVLAKGRTEADLRDALRGGRTCVRSPGACSLEVRAPGGPWVSVGGALHSDAVVEVRARGDHIVVDRDGAAVAMPASGQVERVDVPAGRCSVIRAEVDDGYSAPVYVNCDFADSSEPPSSTGTAP